MYRAHPPEKVAAARQLREAGSSYAEIADEIGISWATARNWTLDLRPDLARSGKDSEAIKRSRARATQAIADAVERGYCRTAGCRIAGCSIPYGSCHCGCGEPAPLAVQSDRKQSYVKGEPHLYVVGHNTFVRTRWADGRVSRSAFVERHGKRYGLGKQALRRAIDAGLLPGEKVTGAGVDPHGHVYLVDEAQLLAALAALPRCRFEGCEKPALSLSGGCGRHAGPLKKRGSWWTTEEGRTFAALLTDPETRHDTLRGHCWICGRPPKAKAPAHVARAWRERRRRVCATCFPVWTGALGHVHAALVWSGVEPTRGVSAGNIAAISQAFSVAYRYEREIHTRWPAKRGLKLEIAVVLVIETLHRLGFTDECVQRLLAAGGLRVGDGYVKKRRKRAQIHRRAA